MIVHTDILAQEAGRYASQISSLSIAANSLMSQSTPADPLVIQTVVTDLLDVIEDLACHIEHSTSTIEKEHQKPDPNQNQAH